MSTSSDWPNRTLNYFKKAINDAIKVLTTGQPSRFEMHFKSQTRRNPALLAVKIAMYDETPPYEIYSSELVHFKQPQFKILMEALSRNSSITELRFDRRMSPLQETLIDPIIRDNVHTCISLLYRGLERMQNIRLIEVNISGDDGIYPLPTFSWPNTRFKPNVTRLDIEGYCRSVANTTIEEITGVMADLTSLNDIYIHCRGFISHATIPGVGHSYFRIISTSLRQRTLNTLELLCKGLTNTQCTWIAQLLVESATRLHTFILGDAGIKIGGVSILMNSLKRNSILRKLLLTARHLTSHVSLIEKYIENMLCDCTTLDNIFSSNHFIEVIIVNKQEYRSGQKRNAMWLYEFRSQTPEVIDDDLEIEGLHFRCQKIRDCLRLNSIANKHQVIRTKILKYYFVNEFDLSRIKSMDLRLLPNILHSILEEQPNSISAIFRILIKTDDWRTLK